MAETVSGFPFWELRFDKDAKPVDDAALQTFLREVKEQGLTDLFVFSHGWNNDPAVARRLYRGFFGEVRKLLDDAGVTKSRQAKVGTAGVIWPSILFPDEDTGADSSGGAASLGGGGASGDFFTELRKVFVEPDQQPVLDELGRRARGGGGGRAEIFSPSSGGFSWSRTSSRSWTIWRGC